MKVFIGLTQHRAKQSSLAVLHLSATLRHVDDIAVLRALVLHGAHHAAEETSEFRVGPRHGERAQLGLVETGQLRHVSHRSRGRYHVTLVDDVLAEGRLPRHPDTAAIHGFSIQTYPWPGEKRLAIAIDCGDAGVGAFKLFHRFLGESLEILVADQIFVVFRIVTQILDNHEAFGLVRRYGHSLHEIADVLRLEVFVDGVLNLRVALVLHLDLRHVDRAGLTQRRLHARLEQHLHHVRQLAHLLL